MPDKDPYRPSFHFAPRRGWINDPNGLVFHQGLYHLFFQHHPYSDDLGPMHWGHAVSRDLIVWEEWPVALFPDALGVIFSGSAIVDSENTAGFGPDAIVAMFTSHNDGGDPLESQSLGYSTDGGHSFDKFEGNPVIVPPPNTPNFRDPRLLWYGDKASGHWIVVLAVGDEVQFYRSNDLKHWQRTGAFGKQHGAHTGVWECPDLFPLTVEGENKTLWVLVVGIGSRGGAQGSGTQYFVGNFDGQSFTPLDAPEAILWLDYGADAYATQSWANVSDGRRIITSWMNNWHYARTIPTSGWRGSMTLPRTLHLLRTHAGYRLAQKPVEQLDNWRSARFSVMTPLSVADSEASLDLPTLACFDISLSLVLSDEVNRCGVRLRDGAHGLVTIGYDRASRQLWFDRSASGVTDFHPDFGHLQHAPLVGDDSQLELRIIVDHASVEIFADQGLACISNLIYPITGQWRIALFADSGEVVLTAAEIARIGGV